MKKLQQLIKDYRDKKRIEKRVRGKRKEIEGELKKDYPEATITLTHIEFEV